MDNFRHTLDAILAFVIQIMDRIIVGIIAIEMWSREQLGQFGLPPNLQTATLVGLAVVLIIASLKLFGGLIRVAAILILVLIALHVLMPAFQP